MRCLACAIVICLTGGAAAQDDERQGVDRYAVRYGLAVNALSYSQKTPEEALRAVVRALEKQRFEYLVAQLADPQLVDERIAEYRDAVPSGSDEAKSFVAFERFLRETQQHFNGEPQLLRELRILARDAEWQMMDDQALGTSKEIAERKVYMRRVGPRWFLQNRQQ